MPIFSPQHPIAFFCAEFGLDVRLPIYAGGLGVLAGDILKEAADQKIPMVGIGLLYRGENARQQITTEGKQQEVAQRFDPLSVGLEHVYLDDMPLFIKVHLTSLDVWVRCWQKKIGETVTLYLLDPDTDQNLETERNIAHALYAGTEEALIKQQLILGIGGVKLIHALGIHPSLYHVNEGRPAFLHWQLIRSYMDDHGMSFEQADTEARQKTVYTNHTLVEAGNQAYTTHLLKAYGTYYAEKAGVTIERLLEPGMEGDRFSMTRYALNTSSQASSVSQLHFQFCQKQWPEYHWTNVTNGVYLPFWQDQHIAAQRDSVEGLWAAHLQAKHQLAGFVHQRTGYQYDPQRLVITWSRRMAGYKQADAIFSDLTRLVKIVKNTQQPVQLLIAGKAHVYDVASKQLIEKIIHIMQQELAGYALFIPDLDLSLDQQLVKGSDLWLNTPKLGQEACGTSGMKALSNGVLQCTVADGWAAEVEWQDLGWQLSPDRVAESFFSLMETQIQPLFAERNEQGIPLRWVKRMKNSIELAKRFSATRMMHEYQEKVYG